MKFQFTNKEKCFQYSTMEIEIPQEIFEQGDKAIKNYILETSEDAEHIELNETVVEESFLEVTEIKHLTEV